MSAPGQKREASPGSLAGEISKRQKHRANEASSQEPGLDTTSAVTARVTVETAEEQAPGDDLESDTEPDTEHTSEQATEDINVDGAEDDPKADSEANPDSEDDAEPEAETEENATGRRRKERKVSNRSEWDIFLDRFTVRGNPGGNFSEYLKNIGYNSRPTMTPRERRQLMTDLTLDTEEQGGQYDNTKSASSLPTSSFAPVDSVEDSVSFLGLDLKNLESIKISPSSSLKLRVDQVQNVAFMVKNAEGILRGAVNANESGTGKTVEALSSVFFLAQRREARPNFTAHRATLILCPHQALRGWQNVYAEFFSSILTLYVCSKSLQSWNNNQIIDTKSVSALTAVLESMEPSDPRTSYTIILATYDDFSSKAFLKERKKEALLGNKQFSIRGAKLAPEAYEAIKIGQKPVLFDLQFEPRIMQMVGTLIADEAHEIKNPKTRRAQAALLVDADITFLLTASPTDNRVSDFRGLLFALYKPREWRIDWRAGVTPEELFAMYYSGFDPFNGKDPAKIQLDPTPSSDYIEALKEGKHLWRLNPHAYRWLGNQMMFSPKFSQVVLGSIFSLCVLRRDLGSFINLPNGPTRTVADIVGIPRVTIKTVELKMDDYHSQEYLRTAGPWFSELFSTGGDTKKWDAARIHQSNEVPMSAFNQAANARLNYITADIGLVDSFRLPRRLPSLLGHPATKVEEINTEDFYAGDKDAGMKFYYTMTRRYDDPLEPPADRVSMIKYLVRRSPKLRWLLVKLDELKQREEKAIVFCVHPRTQWMIEGVCSIAEFNFYSLRSKHDKDLVRPRLFADFNGSANRVDFLLTTMELSGSGVDLSRDCHNLIIFELPDSVPMMMSAIGRIHRVGQTKQQVATILALDRSYDDYTAYRHFSKYSIDLLAQGVLDGSRGELELPQVITGELVRRQLGARVNRSVLEWILERRRRRRRYGRFDRYEEQKYTLWHFASANFEAKTRSGRLAVDRLIARRGARADSQNSPRDGAASAAADDESEANKHQAKEQQESSRKGYPHTDNPEQAECERPTQQPDEHELQGPSEALST